MKYFKKLVGDNIYLSPRNVEDYEKFTEWMNDFETTDYIGSSGQVMSLLGEKKYLEEHIGDVASFAIVSLEDDKLLGSIAIEDINNTRRCGTLGIFIGDREARNKGYGSEAIKLLLDYSFNYLNLHSIKLNVFDFNKRAIACYKKCGFRECGRLRENYFLNGKYYDNIIMDVLSNEFTKSYIRNKNIV